MNLSDLNSAQKEAVVNYQGPVLVLAGAGSGKTRVITYRIAFLLEEKIAEPWEILAVTFTNKAATEMRNRVTQLLRGDIGNLTIGTFHAFGARFLRRHSEAFQRDQRFSIYDEDDQNQILRGVLKDLTPGESVKEYLPKVKSYIGAVKNQLSTPEQVAVGSLDKDRDLYLEAYHRYEETLKKNNAFDFDDLIILPCRLLQGNPQILAEYRRRYRFLLIDEFQDTNLPQGELARLLMAPSGNITAVGDDDQSIYGWRGAHIGNILRFPENYQGVKIFRLEQNYRSTQPILEVAHQVIRRNSERHPKKLWTNRKGGDKPVVYAAADDREEAARITAWIQELLKSHRYSPSDIVILYRTNAQSRPFEDELRKNMLPYVVVGGLRFYERKEIKDFLAYLRILVNPNDVLSLRRIINVPPRGIGEITLNRLLSHATSTGVTLFHALTDAGQIKEIGAKQRKNAELLGKWLQDVRQFAAQENLHAVGEKILLDSGLLEYYQKEDATNFENRKENLGEFLNALQEYSFESGLSALEDLENFLQEVALATDVDQWDPSRGAISLMTLHAAKGLEFPVVFLTGLEDGLFPHNNSLDDPRKVEEERRLFYVGTTRAKDLLYLTYAHNRLRWGQEITWQKPSRFLKDIPDHYLIFEEDLSGILMERLRPALSRRHTLDRQQAQGPASPQTFNVDLTLGTHVRHPQFGEGIVINTEGSGEAHRVLVNFEDVGQKLLLTKYAKLHIIKPS
jgi:DNA helicase-2/ATP-dependent DNA helicase PcrA